MKIIDLLNKIANGEEVPKKIAIQNEVLIYNEDEILNLQDCYYMVDDEDATWKIWAYELNDEVEILDDEEDKDISLIPDDELYIINKKNGISKLNETKCVADKDTALNYNFKVLKEKINQILEVINNEHNK